MGGGGKIKGEIAHGLGDKGPIGAQITREGKGGRLDSLIQEQ